MIGRIYTFERASGEALSPAEAVSTAVVRVIEASINADPGICYLELTDSRNVKPMFAIRFRNVQAKARFEDLFGPALDLCRLRVNIVQAVPEGKLGPTNRGENEFAAQSMSAPASSD